MLSGTSRVMNVGDRSRGAFAFLDDGVSVIAVAGITKAIGDPRFRGCASVVSGVVFDFACHLLISSLGGFHVTLLAPARQLSTQDQHGASLGDGDSSRMPLTSPAAGRTNSI